MQIILLSGGSGKRLWPLSNDVRSKQFIKFFKTEDGGHESMVQRMYNGIKRVIPDADITVATGKSQASSLMNQLGESVEICVEPARRDTFPAIALAAAFLKYVKNIDEEEAVVVCPVDPYVEDDYFEAICRIGEAVKENGANITLMGIKPTYPSEKYGYIVPREDGTVESFKEKPDLEGAKALLQKNALWNGGVFGFKLGYMIGKTHEFIDYKDFTDLKARYDSLTKISIDYAVVEKEQNIRVISFGGDWMDVGTWKTLTDVMEEHSVGNVHFDDTCENTHVINEIDVPILAMGLKNVVVAASADGIIVADKNQSSYMKPYVDKIEGPVMYAEKSWGSYRVLDIEDAGMTVKVTLMPGHSMNYHSHERRDEIWTVIEGEGVAIVDGKNREVGIGDTIFLPRGCKHTIKATTLLKVMEVQVGTDIDVKDKIKHEL
ncbi:MAG: cupin domain-containing protein [Lachnospiraceae bacterium]|nr:cupin domain-containing protein [Lachnospiraceae bacterium]